MIERRWALRSRRRFAPVDVLRYAIEELGHSQAELADILGSRSRASELLTRRRPLITLAMIQKINASWKIPADLLVQPYRVCRNRSLSEVDDFFRPPRPRSGVPFGRCRRTVGSCLCPQITSEMASARSMSISAFIGCGFRKRTPSPPRLSAMSSIPALSSAPRMAASFAWVTGISPSTTSALRVVAAGGSATCSSGSSIPPSLDGGDPAWDRSTDP
jgi:HTH-type transcriptional regulator / antitoxin HigA